MCVVQPPGGAQVPKSKLMTLPLGLMCSMARTLSTTPPRAAMTRNSLVLVNVPPNRSAPTTR